MRTYSRTLAIILARCVGSFARSVYFFLLFPSPLPLLPPLLPFDDEASANAQQHGSGGFPPAFGLNTHVDVGPFRICSPSARYVSARTLFYFSGLWDSTTPRPLQRPSVSVLLLALPPFHFVTCKPFPLLYVSSPSRRFPILLPSRYFPILLFPRPPSSPQLATRASFLFSLSQAAKPHTIPWSPLKWLPTFSRCK